MFLIGPSNPTAAASFVNVVNSPGGRDRAKALCKVAETPSGLRNKAHQSLLFDPILFPKLCVLVWLSEWIKNCFFNHQMAHLIYYDYSFSLQGLVNFSWRSEERRVGKECLL